MNDDIISFIEQAVNHPEQKETLYDDIAMAFFNHCRLLPDVNNDSKTYKLAEIEIYLTSTKKVDGRLRDVFCHCHEKQGTMFEFYEHYSGYDITIGNKDMEFMGGILLRGIEQERNYLYGPGRVYDALGKNPKLDFGGKNSFSLLKKRKGISEINGNDVIKTKRVNLSLDPLHKSNYDDNSMENFFLKARYIRISSFKNISRADKGGNPKNADDILWEIRSMGY
ncbi:MAG TPA: hypothetical protein PK200_11440 [Spirochaetota bacterium]|nr:hypothetical protein [Spirochaetota bacterium]HQO04070.1 hypothetical protein [Spirochaetota bacterium]HQP50218.1 hypothetical protein [Spirochaetota bacterium]